MVGPVLSVLLVIATAWRRRRAGTHGADRPLRGGDTPTWRPPRHRPDAGAPAPISVRPDAPAPAPRRPARRPRSAPGRGLLCANSRSRHGSSAVTTVGPPTGEATTNSPSTESSRSASPASPDPAETSAPPRPSSRTWIISRSSDRHTSTDGGPRPAVLADVLEQLGGGEVRDALDGLRGPGRQVHGDRHRHGAARGHRGQRRVQAAVGEDRRVDAAGEVAQLLEGDLHLAVRLADHPARPPPGPRAASPWPGRGPWPARPAGPARRRAGRARSGAGRRRRCRPPPRGPTPARRSAAPARPTAGAARAPAPGPPSSSRAR